MEDDRTAGEQLFEAYLRAHGYPTPEHEPDLGVGKRPDYVISRAGEQCVCEVKEFAPDTSSLPAWSGTTSMGVVLKPIRSQIREAARQLKPLADSGRPLVAVLTNPHGASVHSGDSEVIWAMYGDPVVKFSVNTETGAAEEDPIFTVDRNGKLRGDHQYISAVAFVRDRERAADFYDDLLKRNAHLAADERYALIRAAADSDEVPEGTYQRIDVFRTLSPTAVALSDVFFDGPRDRLIEYDPVSQVYRQVRGPTL